MLGQESMLSMKRLDCESPHGRQEESQLKRRTNVDKVYNILYTPKEPALITIVYKHMYKMSVNFGQSSDGYFGHTRVSHTRSLRSMNRDTIYK